MKKDLKRIIRARMEDTGESYSTARVHVLRDQQETMSVGMPAATPLFRLPASETVRAAHRCNAEQALEAAILKINENSARVRLLSTGEEITFRSSDVVEFVPGQIVSLLPRRRWTHRGYDYASGEVLEGWIDVPALGLPALQLSEEGPADYQKEHASVEEPALFRALWTQATAEPRSCFELEDLRELGDKPEVPSTFDASDLIDVEDNGRARDILMRLLAGDLRILDAHALLGNIAFRLSPEEALLHYEVGVRIAEQALGPEFSGLLPWGFLGNRPFLRCLHGYGLTLWRLGKFQEAMLVFERMLWLNPGDNQGIRYCWLDIRKGRSWQEVSGEGRTDA